MACGEREKSTEEAAVPLPGRADAAAAAAAAAAATDAADARGADARAVGAGSFSFTVGGRTPLSARVAMRRPGMGTGEGGAGVAAAGPLDAWAPALPRRGSAPLVASRAPGSDAREPEPGEGVP